MPPTGAHYVGWLLRANRTLGPAGDLRSGRAFAKAFRPALAPSQITRWETGALTAGRATVRRYERLLGLEPESLVTVRDALYRTLPAARRPSPGAASPPDDARLHDLLDLATSSDPVTGTQWSELTELIESRADLVLHPARLWEEVAHKLLDELTRHEGTGWLLRQEAASRLLEHPAAGGHVVRACITLIDDRSSPAVIEPFGLLDVRADPVGNAYVLRQLDAPDSDRHYRGALLAVVRKIEEGHFAGAQWTRLGRILESGPGGEGDSGRLLSSALFAYGRRPVAPRSDSPAGTGSRVAAADDVLAALVDQALGPSVEERLIAAMTIARSPYREAVAGGLLAEVRRDLAGLRDVATTLGTITLLGSDAHRPLLCDLLAAGGHDDGVREAAAWATPHCAGRFTEQQWRRILHRQVTAWLGRPVAVNESVLHGIAYGIGTDRHGDLLAEIAADGRLPAVARTTAGWLRN